MTDEAIRQVTGINETFRLKHVIVMTACVVPEEKSIEMITSLRFCRLTDTQNNK